MNLTNIINTLKLKGPLIINNCTLNNNTFININLSNPLTQQNGWLLTATEGIIVINNSTASNNMINSNMPVSLI